MTTLAPNKHCLPICISDAAQIEAPLIPVSVSYTHLDVYKRQALNTAIDTAFNKNGAGASPVNGLCSPYNTSATGTFDPNLSLGCIEGGIQKIASSYTMPNNTNNILGRGTLWVNGNLTINSNITYGAAVGTTADLKNLPNLAIYATGDIIICLLYTSRCV